MQQAVVDAGRPLPQLTDPLEVELHVSALVGPFAGDEELWEVVVRHLAVAVADARALDGDAVRGVAGAVADRDRLDRGRGEEVGLVGHGAAHSCVANVSGRGPGTGRVPVIAGASLAADTGIARGKSRRSCVDAPQCREPERKRPGKPGRSVAARSPAPYQPQVWPWFCSFSQPCSGAK